jgi:hypothetical protein
MERNTSPVQEPQRDAMDHARRAAADVLPDVVERAGGAVTPGLVLLATVPPLVGVGLIAIVAGDIGDSIVTRSNAAAVAALLVGCVLILGSAGLFVLAPKRYDHFFSSIRELLQGPSPEAEHTR